MECEFYDKEGRTVLKPEDWRQEGFIFPKTEEERCTDPNCFSHAFKYSASADQLEVSRRHGPIVYESDSYCMTCTVQYECTSCTSSMI